MRARLALLVAVLLLGACELRTELNVDVRDDGSGTVHVGIGVDDEVLERRPDLLDELALDDLAGEGWEVAGPTVEGDDLTWIRLSRGFAAPEELGPLVADVAGEDGPFRDFGLVVDDGLVETTYRFTGAVDFSGGAGDLAADPALAEELGGDVLERIDDEATAAVDQLVRVQVGVRLPGSVSSNAPTQASNGAVWRPSVLEPGRVDLDATGTVTHGRRVVGVVVGAAATGALVLFVAVRVAVRRRQGLAGSG